MEDPNKNFTSKMWERFKDFECNPVTDETREWFRNLESGPFVDLGGDSARLTPERAKRLAETLVPRDRK